MKNPEQIKNPLIFFQLIETMAKKYQPISEPVTTEDIARSVVFLASDDARIITGTTHVIDGGWQLAGAQPDH